MMDIDQAAEYPKPMDKPEPLTMLETKEQQTPSVTDEVSVDSAPRTPRPFDESTLHVRNTSERPEAGENITTKAVEETRDDDNSGYHSSESGASGRTMFYDAVPTLDTMIPLKPITEASEHSSLVADSTGHSRFLGKSPSSPTSQLTDWGYDTTTHSRVVESSMHSRLNSTHFRRDENDEDCLDFLFEKIERMACTMDGEPETLKDILDEVFEYFEDIACGDIARERNSAIRHNFESFLQGIDTIANLKPKGSNQSESGENINKDLLDVVCSHFEKVSCKDASSRKFTLGRLFDKDLMDDVYEFIEGGVCTSKKGGDRPHLSEEHQPSAEPREIGNLLSVSDGSIEENERINQPLFKISEEGSFTSAYSSGNPVHNARRVAQQKAVREQLVRRTHMRKLRGNIHSQVKPRDVVRKVTKCRETVHEAFGTASTRLSNAATEIVTILEKIDMVRIWELMVLGHVVDAAKREENMFATDASPAPETISPSPSCSTGATAASQYDNIVVYRSSFDSAVRMIHEEQIPEMEARDPVEGGAEPQKYTRRAIEPPEERASATAISTRSAMEPLEKISEDAEQIVSRIESTGTREKIMEQVLESASDETHASGNASKRSDPTFKRSQQVQEIQHSKNKLDQKIGEAGRSTPNSAITDRTCDESLSDGAMGMGMGMDNSDSTRLEHLQILADLSIHGSNRHSRSLDLSGTGGSGSTRRFHQTLSLDGAKSKGSEDDGSASVDPSGRKSNRTLYPDYYPSSISKQTTISGALPQSLPVEIVSTPGSKLNHALSLNEFPSTEECQEDTTLHNKQSPSFESEIVSMQSDSFEDSIDEMPSIPYIETAQSSIVVEESTPLEVETSMLLETVDSKFTIAQSHEEQEPEVAFSFVQEIISQAKLDSKSCISVDDDDNDDEFHSSDELSTTSLVVAQSTSSQSTATASTTSLMLNPLTEKKVRSARSCALVEDTPEDEIHRPRGPIRNSKSSSSLPKMSGASMAIVPSGNIFSSIVEMLNNAGSNWYDSKHSISMKALLLMIYVSMTVATSANDVVKAHLEKRKEILRKKMAAQNLAEEETASEPAVTSVPQSDV